MFFIKNLIFKSLTDRQFETLSDKQYLSQKQILRIQTKGINASRQIRGVHMWGGYEDWAPLHKCLFNHPWKVRKVKPPGLIPEYAPTTDPQHMFMIKQERKLTKSSGRRNLFFEQWNWVLASNSDFLSPISLQPNVVDLRYFKV